MIGAATEKRVHCPRFSLVLGEDFTFYTEMYIV